MKKKKLKIILIAVVVAVVIIAVAVFASLLRKDGRGMNAFDRSKVVASAGGQSITMGELAMGLDNSINYYYQYYGATYSGDELKQLQENVAKDLILQKIYTAKANELGIGLTAEEIASCKKTAKDQLATLEETIGKQLSTSGNFSKANLESQINEYFTRQLGMNKSQYKAYIETQEKASLSLKKVQAYYADSLTGYTDEEFLAFYDEEVKENYADGYTDGAYAMQMYYYMLGYSSTPYLYVPEGFIYIDSLSYTAATEEEANAFADKAKEIGDFDTIAEESGVYTDHDHLPAPYAIGPNDWFYILDSQDTYDAVAALEVGELTTVVVPNTTNDSDTGETVTTSYSVYVIERVEGTMCENGASYGIVDIDHYNLRDAMKSDFEEHRFVDLTETWLTDLNLSDAIYSYPAE